jgi:hypothetical protein
MISSQDTDMKHGILNAQLHARAHSMPSRAIHDDDDGAHSHLQSQQPQLGWIVSKCSATSDTLPPSPSSSSSVSAAMMAQQQEEQGLLQ